MIESLLLAVTRVTTMSGQKALTSATGFFFEQDGRLFLVTNRHVVLDEASAHHPDRLEIELHVAAENVAVTRQFSIPLYRNRKSVWRDGRDSKGPVDVAVLELDNPASNARAKIGIEIARALEEDHAEAIVLGCAGMADLAASLSVEFGVPVIDGVAAAVVMAEGLAAIGLRTSKRGGFASPLPKTYSGQFAPFSPKR